MAHVPTRSLELAEKSLGIALTLCPTDPLVHHELGVVCYKNREYVCRPIASSLPVVRLFSFGSFSYLATPLFFS
jgi:hypothetical protein